MAATPVSPSRIVAATATRARSRNSPAAAMTKSSRAQFALSGFDDRGKNRGRDDNRGIVRVRDRDDNRVVLRSRDFDDRRLRGARMYGDRFDDDRFDRRFAGLGWTDGCPPGLAKKHNGCLPPGQAKKVWGNNVWGPAQSYRRPIIARGSSLLTIATTIVRAWATSCWTTMTITIATATAMCIGSIATVTSSPA